MSIFLSMNAYTLWRVFIILGKLYWNSSWDQTSRQRFEKKGLSTKHFGGLNTTRSFDLDTHQQKSELCALKLLQYNKTTFGSKESLSLKWGGLIIKTKCRSK